MTGRVLRFFAQLGVLALVTGALGTRTSGESIKPARKMRIALLDLPILASQAVGEHRSHGQTMVQEIEKVCASRCEPLSVVLSQTGTDLTAQKYAEGLAEALRLKADVIVIPSGARAGVHPLDEKRLSQALGRAASRGVPVFVAAGTGLQNPFRPEPLSTLIPQKFNQAWVVAAAGTTPFEDETLRSAQNFGPELRFRVMAPSSSVAAVRLAAWVGRRLSEFRAQGRAHESLPALNRQLRRRFGVALPLSELSRTD